MRNKLLKVVVLAQLISATAIAQIPYEEGKKALEGENYFRAKNKLLTAMNEGFDRNLTAYYLGNTYLQLDETDSAKMYYRMLGANNNTAMGYLARGRLALLDGDKTKAKELFEQAAITSKMKNSEILYQIGNAWFRPTISDLNEAIRNFEDAYKLDNKNSVNMLALGDAYLENNEGGKAMSKYESAAEVNTKLTTAFIKIGRLNVRARTYDDAIIAYNKAINLEPENPIAHKELGESYFLSKKYDLAKIEFRKYIDLNKEDADAKTRFISFLFANKEYDQVATEAAKMLEEDPNNYILMRALAYANFELKRYKEGLDYSKRFWTSAPSAKVRPLDYVYASKLANVNGDTAMALKYFAIALANDTNNGDLLSDYAKVLMNTNRFAEAAATYQKKINRFNGTSLDYYYLGRSLMKLKNYALADSAFAVFVSKNPTSPDGFVQRAKANSMIDPEMKSGAAKPFYEKFIELAGADPERNKRNLIEAYDYLGAYFLNKNDKGSARGYLNKALELDPADGIAVELSKGL
ncbi:MAG: tetratricopeptide repeat protein [Chitinophagales bacterium]